MSTNPASREGDWTDIDRAMLQLVPTEYSAFESLEVHRGMLSDTAVLEHFRASLRELVKTGHTVVDLGAGLGLLAFFSVAAGAQKIYAIERNRTLGLAEQIAKDNLIDERIVFISANSTQVHLPRRADLIVSQTIGHLGFDEDILKWMIDARERMLVTGGRLIPCAVELYMVPASSRRTQEALSFWTSRPYDLDMSVVARHAASNIYVVDMLPAEIFAPPKPIYVADLHSVTEPSFSAASSYLINKDCVIRGLAGWFRAKLTDSITIDTSPYSRRTHWRQCYLPLTHPITVSGGDIVHVEVEMLSVDGSSPVWAWSVSSNVGNRESRQVFKQSTSRVPGPI